MIRRNAAKGGSGECVWSSGVMFSFNSIKGIWEMNRKWEMFYIFYRG